MIYPNCPFIIQSRTTHIHTNNCLRHSNIVGANNVDLETDLFRFVWAGRGTARARSPAETSEDNTLLVCVCGFCLFVVLVSSYCASLRKEESVINQPP